MCRDEALAVLSRRSLQALAGGLLEAAERGGDVRQVADDLFNDACSELERRAAVERVEVHSGGALQETAARIVRERRLRPAFRKGRNYRTGRVESWASLYDPATREERVRVVWAK